MPTSTDDIRTAVARLILAGDFQELVNLYTGGDVALTPDDVARLYPSNSLSADERRELEEVIAALPDDLLPRSDSRTTVPAEAVELAARYALERGKNMPAVRALREAEALDKFYETIAKFALESLEAGDERAAFELCAAGRLGWARMNPEARREFLAELGINRGELATCLGAEISRGRITGGRALAEFPTWQTYGPLFHARCYIEPCVSDLPVEILVERAIRFLLHDPELAQQALTKTDDPVKLLRALVSETDPKLSEFTERHALAMERYHKLHDEGLIRDARLESLGERQKPAEEQVESPIESQDADAQAETAQESENDAERLSAEKAEAARQGLREVQTILLGREEDEWRNALAELAATHPLSMFSVCVVRSYDLGTFVIPSGQGWDCLVTR